MNRIPFILLLLLLSASNSHAQKFIADLNTDSLKKVLRTAKDTTRANTLNFYARRQLYMQQDSIGLMEAQIMTDEAFAISNKLNYNRGKENSFLNKGILAAYMGKHSEALNFLFTARSLNHLTKDKLSLGAIYDFTGMALQQKGENHKAISYFDSARNYYNYLGDSITAIWSILSIGKAYYVIGDYSNAYKTYQAAFDLAPSVDTTLKILSLYNMATLFLSAGLPELTLKQLAQVYSYFPANDLKELLVSRPEAQSAIVMSGEAYLQLGLLDSARIVANLLGPPKGSTNIFYNMFWGRLQSALNKYDLALPPLHEGLALAKEFNQPLFISRLQIDLAKVYVGMKQYDTALYYAEQGMTTAKNIDALLEMTMAAGALSEAYAGLKVFEKAWQFSQLQKTLKDSLISEEDKRKIALVQVEKELAVQKKDGELKAQELRKESLLNKLLILGLALFAVITIIGFRNISLQRRNEKLRYKHEMQIKEFETENATAKLQKHAADLEMQALRAQMNPHFIFNCLNAINHFIQKNETETASDYLTKFSRLIRMVLQSSSHKYISLQDELETLKLYIGMESVRFKDHFTYTINVDPDIDTENIQIPPMLLQPFVENAIWHGLMHMNENGKLNINIEEENDMLTCTIQDNGIGRKKAAELKSKSASYKKSLGMQITENRLQLLYRGHGGGPAMKIIDLEDENNQPKGTKIILRLPVRFSETVEA